MEHEIHIDDYAEPAHQQTADFLESVWTFADFGGPVADWNQFLPSLDVSRRLGDNGTLNWRALKYWRELKR